MCKLLTTRTPDELKELAKSIFKGEIFTDRHVKPNEGVTLGMIFMPLMFLDGKYLEEAKKVGMIYAHMKDAYSRSINGYPTFFTMSCLSIDDTETVLKHYDKLKAFEDEL